MYHSSSLLKFSLRPRFQQQMLYKSGHLFFASYVSFSMPHTLIHQAQYCNFLPFSLQKHCLNVHKHASQACTITYPKSKLSSPSSPPLQPCLLNVKINTSKNKKWDQDKPIEAKRTVKVDSFFKTTLFVHILKKISTSTFLLVHIRITPSEGPMALKTNFL